MSSQREFVVNQDSLNPYASADDAIAAVEALGTGSVTLFLGSPNMPHCKPDTVWRSNAMWQFHEGKWFEMSIFSGTCERLYEGRPK
jgi:hypothetical protein